MQIAIIFIGFWAGLYILSEIGIQAAKHYQKKQKKYNPEKENTDDPAFFQGEGWENHK